VTGHARSGKNTVAEIFVKARFKQLALADKVKHIAMMAFRWDGKKDEKGRKLLIEIGAKLREIDPDVWINWLVDSNNVYMNNVVISDIRYKNEAEWIKNNDGLLIKVIRIGLPDADADWRSTPSETELDDYEADYTIIAEKLSDLKKQVYEVRHKILEKRYGALHKACCDCFE